MDAINVVDADRQTTCWPHSTSIRARLRPKRRVLYLAGLIWPIMTLPAFFDGPAFQRRLMAVPSCRLHHFESQPERSRLVHALTIPLPVITLRTPQAITADGPSCSFHHQMFQQARALIRFTASAPLTLRKHTALARASSLTIVRTLTTATTLQGPSFNGSVKNDLGGNIDNLCCGSRLVRILMRNKVTVLAGQCRAPVVGSPTYNNIIASAKNEYFLAF